MATKATIDKAKVTLTMENYQVLKPNELRCICCSKNRSVWQDNWFMSDSPVHQGNTALYKWKDKEKKEHTRQQAFAPICRKCIDGVYLKNGDIEDVIESLRLLDKPFIKDTWNAVWNKEKARMNVGSIFGTYISNMTLNHRGLTFKDSDLTDNEETELENKSHETKLKLKVGERKTCQIKWGMGYEDYQYIMLENLYDDMIQAFDIDNPSQAEYLKTACLYQMRNVEAIREGESQEAKRWGDLFDSYMGSSKLKPSQMSDADKMGGVTNFSNFFKYVEKTNKFTPKFPDLILDDLDYKIWSYTNYVRELKDMPPMELGEVKDFMTYDYEVGQQVIFPTKEKDDDEEGDADG